MQPPVRRRTNPSDVRTYGQSICAASIYAWNPARRAWPQRHLALARHTTMNKRLSTISYQLSAALVLTIIGYLPSALAQVPASGPDGFASASAGATYDAASKPRMTEPLEKPATMPPAYIYRLETGPRMTSQFGLFTSFQVNVDANGNNILGDAANESSITVDPTNHNRMAIGWRQFDSVQSDFRQGGWGFTTDGGTTWTFPGVLQDNVFRSDPVLGSDEAGNFFYLSLLESFCDNMYGSLNFGQTWTRLQPDGDAGGGDKQWFTIDKTGGTGHGFQYQAWSTAAPCSFGQFSRSTDGGVTWMNPINIPDQPVWGTLDVDTNGNLFIGGGDFGSSFFCVRSSNAQNPAVTPSFDQERFSQPRWQRVIWRHDQPRWVGGPNLPCNRPLRHCYQQQYLYACHGAAVQRR